MTNKKLFKLLALVNVVKSNSWNDVIKIVETMSFVEVIEKKWADKYKQDNLEQYPLDLSKIETWSTFDNECIDLVFKIENNKLICKVNIYDDGDSFNGYRKKLRFSAKLQMPNIFIKQLEAKILYAFHSFAEESYEKYLENQKNLWIHDFKSDILEKTKSN